MQVIFRKGCLLGPYKSNLASWESDRYVLGWLLNSLISLKARPSILTHTHKIQKKDDQHLSGFELITSGSRGMCSTSGLQLAPHRMLLCDKKNRRIQREIKCTNYEQSDSMTNEKNLQQAPNFDFWHGSCWPLCILLFSLTRKHFSKLNNNFVREETLQISLKALTDFSRPLKVPWEQENELLCQN